MPKVDALLIGPGIEENPETQRAVAKILTRAHCGVVLDAQALRHAIVQSGLGNITITPHRGEMNKIIEKNLPKDPVEEQKIVGDFAEKWNLNILLKGARDLIFSAGKPTRMNETGNAGMTVGGTGDVLAGVTASLIAQHMNPYEGCICAAFVTGLAGDNCANQKGLNFIATDLAHELPYTIKNIL